MVADFYQAIRDRHDRAIEVEETYTIESLGLQSWVVQHGNEPERCYFVDFLRRHYACPDFLCVAQGNRFPCKHLLAIAPLWEQLTGLTFERQINYPAYAEEDVAFSQRMADVSHQDPFDRI